MVPSNQDIDYSVAHEEKYLNMPISRMPSPAQREETGPQVMARYQVAKQTYENRIHELRHFRRHAGTLFAGSGNRKSDDNFVLDWALIKLPSHREMVNMVSSFQIPWSD